MRSTTPALLILDFDMPGLDGGMVGKTIRRFYDLPILFLSGEPEEKLREVSAGIPNSTYLRKTHDIASALPAKVELIGTRAPLEASRMPRVPGGGP